MSNTATAAASVLFLTTAAVVAVVFVVAAAAATATAATATTATTPRVHGQREKAWDIVPYRVYPMLQTRNG